jgi:hypothetical protein
MRAVKKAVIVVAERFGWSEAVWPKGVFAVRIEDGAVISDPKEVPNKSFCDDYKFYMATPGGFRDIEHGDYVVSSPSGCRYPVSQKSFFDNYEVTSGV